MSLQLTRKPKFQLRSSHKRKKSCYFTLKGAIELWLDCNISNKFWEYAALIIFQPTPQKWPSGATRG